jgi:methyl-accepting chemotaxis protein
MSSGSAVPASDGTRFRWTIARKITALVVLAVGLLAGVGLLAITSVASLQRLSAHQASLATARGALIDMDMQKSNATIALNRSLLATTDAERQHADNLLTGAAGAAKKDMDRIRALDLPDAASQLNAIMTDFEKYLSTQQSAIGVAKTVDPTGAEAKKALADDDDRSAAVEQTITDRRAALTALVDKAVSQAGAKATSVKISVAVTLVVAIVLLAGIGWALVRTVRQALYGLRDRMTDIAEGEGDLTARLPEQASDETGEVARAVNTFIARVQAVIR